MKHQKLMQKLLDEQKIAAEAYTEISKKINDLTASALNH